MKPLHTILLPAALLCLGMNMAHARDGDMNERGEGQRRGAHHVIIGESTLKSTPFADTTYGDGAITGEAHLKTNRQGTQTTVVVHVEGLIPGTTHVGHIHNGDCSALTPGAILHSLDPLTVNERGLAISKTTFNGTMAGLKDCEWWVAVHEGPTDTDPQSPAVATGPVLIKGNN